MSPPPSAVRRAQLVAGAPNTSHWLHDAILGALARDPVDALNDAEALVRILRQWADEVLRGGP